MQYEAVRLFIDRAVSVKADFLMTNENAPAVAAICHRLDGLPLAIELAASRVRVFEPERLLLSLDRGLGTTLTGGSRDLSARQQTLKGAIAWSVDLLSADERMLFSRLSVFLGGFTMEAAEAVGSDPGDPGMVGDLDILSGIESLADKSLVRRDGGDVADPRFRRLETIRDHAVGMAREAGMEAGLRDRHPAWITDLFTRNEAASRRVGAGAVMERLHAELGNLRQALAWASGLPVDGARVTLGLRLCVASGNYWHMRHDAAEGSAGIERLLALVDPLVEGGSGTPETQSMIPPDVLAHARTTTMRLRAPAFVGPPSPWVRLALEDAVAYFRRAGDRRGEDRAIHALSDFVAGIAGDGPESTSLALDAITVASDAGDDFTCLFAHGRVGIADWEAGRDREAEERFATALRLAEALGDPNAVGPCHYLLGRFQFNRSQWAESDRHLSHSETSWAGHSAISLYLRAEIAMHAGNHPVASEHLDRLADRIASGLLPGRYSALVRLGRGSMARLEERFGDATADLRDALTVDLESSLKGFAQHALVGLAMLGRGDPPGGNAREMLGRALALDPNGRLWPSHLPSIIAGVSEVVVARNPTRGVALGEMAWRLGTRSWYRPMYVQDIARVTSILDEARAAHGIPVPDLSSDLTAADAISQCREALALIS